jgi:hypothetical protein
LVAAPKDAHDLDVTIAGSQASRWDAIVSRSLREAVVAGGSCTKCCRAALIRDRQAPAPQCLLTEINLTAKRIARFFLSRPILINEVGKRGTDNFILKCSQFFGLCFDLGLKSSYLF